MGVLMPNTLLGRHVAAHESHCVCSFACWWREMLELEVALEYRRSSPELRRRSGMECSECRSQVQTVLDAELRACVSLWSASVQRGHRMCGTPLDVLLAVAKGCRLELPRFALLAAFRLSRVLADGSLPGCIGVKEKAAG